MLGEVTELSANLTTFRAIHCTAPDAGIQHLGDDLSTSTRDLLLEPSMQLVSIDLYTGLSISYSQFLNMYNIEFLLYSLLYMILHSSSYTVKCRIRSIHNSFLIPGWNPGKAEHLLLVKPLSTDSY